jgi:hypothetical protein
MASASNAKVATTRNLREQGQIHDRREGEEMQEVLPTMDMVLYWWGRHTAM